MCLMACDRVVLSKKLSVMHIIILFRSSARNPSEINAAADRVLEARSGFTQFCMRIEIDCNPALLLATTIIVANSNSTLLIGMLVILNMVSGPTAINIRP